MVRRVDDVPQRDGDEVSERHVAPDRLRPDGVEQFHLYLEFNGAPPRRFIIPAAVLGAARARSLDSAPLRRNAPSGARRVSGTICVYP